VKGNDVVFGWEMEGNRETTFTVAFKGTIESATRMTGTVGSPFCGNGGQVDSDEKEVTQWRDHSASSLAAVVPPSHDTSNPLNFHPPIRRVAIQLKARLFIGSRFCVRAGSISPLAPKSQSH
jgi:hypothetical protein